VNVPCAIKFFALLLDAAAAESDFGKLLHVEEVRVAQVRVAPLDAGVDARGFDDGVDRRFRHVLVVVDDLDREVRELSLSRSTARRGWVSRSRCWNAPRRRVLRHRAVDGDDGEEDGEESYGQMFSVIIFLP
jgi:hypothetical protein